MNDARIVLLVFVDPASDPKPVEAKLRKELAELVRQEMGERLVPDQIRVYPLSPWRTEDGVVDHAWCRWQFLTGELQKKAADELFRLSSLVRRRARVALEEGA